MSQHGDSPPRTAPANVAPVRLMVILLLLLAAALVYVVLRPPPGPANAPQKAAAVIPEPRTIVARGDLASDETSTIDLFSAASPSVVHVTSLKLRRSRLSLNITEIPQGTGSGFVWDKEGHIVTNYHVIKDGKGAEVTLQDNTVWKARIVGRAPDKDLAILEIEAPAAALSPLALGSSSNLQVGQKVFAIGNPFGLDQTLTTGVISGLGREIQSVTKRPIQGVIQTDAAINPGNSGGPLLDSAGRLIGVNTAIFSTSGAYAGIGFAVPVDTVNRIVPQLVEHGEVTRPGLGVQIGTDQSAARLGVRGVIVWEVPEESAAGEAGIEGVRPGRGGRWLLGDVIVGVEGEGVRSANDLYRALDTHEVGEAIVIRLSRNGGERDVKVQLQPLR
ncbi:MAG: trypsin-like serine protease [Myxococcales bacterium]|nr:trypsin-like serine protease [Myxococcales bacterium]